jgi:hypothetical protein
VWAPERLDGATACVAGIYVDDAQERDKQSIRRPGILSLGAWGARCRLQATLQAHTAGVSQVAMSAAQPPLMMSTAADARVSIWDPSTWRPVCDFGGDDAYVFGGEEAWEGPRVTRAMVMLLAP